MHTPACTHLFWIAFLFLRHPPLRSESLAEFLLRFFVPLLLFSKGFGYIASFEPKVLRVSETFWTLGLTSKITFQDLETPRRPFGQFILRLKMRSTKVPGKVSDTRSGLP